MVPFMVQVRLISMGSCRYFMDTREVGGEEEGDGGLPHVHRRSSSLDRLVQLILFDATTHLRSLQH